MPFADTLYYTRFMGGHCCISSPQADARHAAMPEERARRHLPAYFRLADVCGYKKKPPSLACQDCHDTGAGTKRYRLAPQRQGTIAEAYCPGRFRPPAPPVGHRDRVAIDARWRASQYRAQLVTSPRAEAPPGRCACARRLNASPGISHCCQHAPQLLFCQ